MIDKITQITDYIIARIESGEYRAGEPIPVARKLAIETGASFAMVQHAVTRLGDVGILQSISRKATILQPDWQTRLVPNNVFMLHADWAPAREIRKLMTEDLPEFHPTGKFARGMFELQATLFVQQNQNDYMDLSPFFNELFPDRSIFFEQPFEGFRTPGGVMYGIPWRFSPRVMFYNPELLAAAGCPEPEPDWNWRDFISMLRKLKQRFPGRPLCNLSANPFFWMNFVLRSGGSIIDGGQADPVRLDSAESIRGIQAVRELYTILDGVEPDQPGTRFASGELPFAVESRELLSELERYRFRDWKNIPLPRMPGGRDLSAQVTSLICVHKECADRRMVRKFIEFMLSEKVQNCVGKHKFGLPILRSAASASVDMADPRDVLFVSEIAHMSAEYNLHNPAMANLVREGVKMLIRNPELDTADTLGRISDALRLMHAINQTT